MKAIRKFMSRENFTDRNSLARTIGPGICPLTSRQTRLGLEPSGLQVVLETVRVYWKMSEKFGHELHQYAYISGDTRRRPLCVEISSNTVTRGPTVPRGGTIGAGCVGGSRGCSGSTLGNLACLASTWGTKDEVIIWKVAALCKGSLNRRGSKESERSEDLRRLHSGVAMLGILY